MTDNHKVEWFGAGRKAQCPPDPRFPTGIDLVAVPPGTVQACKVDIPYPAPEIGQWKITCSTCGFTAMATAAGRTDDPRSATIPCKM